MSVLKKLFIGVILVAVLVMGIGFLLPSDFRVERSVIIKAPSEQIYPLIADLKEWKRWGGWFARDPNMLVTYSGPDSSIGMKSSWTSATEGSGEMTITALQPNTSVKYDLYFPEFEMGSTGELTLIDVSDGTKVVWRDYGDVGSNPIKHYFALMMDSMIGPDFQQGLENLKALVEN
ncbi:SRPBCC family protein [Aliiglaciecola sp. LCG003]|uniref:SRPBCC family protein n=1 Tax=Aliiglaciecola sp. LCG003 TaxID=3053655 RepID=UPI00257341A4|nr:SRPBCC family protein [Aliiglaciecola sp. LCG003]WJG07914.1 SRPBCC family protein [Aliiglaciecola sp. LCG003]